MGKEQLDLDFKEVNHPWEALLAALNSKNTTKKLEEVTASFWVRVSNVVPASYNTDTNFCSRCGSPTGKWWRCTNSSCSNSY